MPAAPAAHELERRKRVRLRLRTDLGIKAQKYEGKTYFVVKDPVTLRYYRFKEQERFLLDYMDGKHTLDEAQKEYEKRFRPERLTLEDLEGFAQQLLTAGLVQNESPNAGKQLFEYRRKRKRSQFMQAVTNILYIKIPLFDPDKLLTRMVPWLGWVFSIWFFALSAAVMMSAIVLVATHFDTFTDKLPSYHEFFSFKTVAYLWVALGVVKVIHEFGHGLSCKKFGGEVHEMGLLFLVFSPCMYCNVSDSWMIPSKWKRIVISSAGIYVELLIAAIATFVWWNTPNQPFINNLSLSLMIVCSVSTVVFNANPLMRYDGYYVLADWIEIPNLRERSNRYLTNRFLETALGVEVQPEQYMAQWRKNLFIFYAILSYVYRWVITFVILYFLYNFLKPYKLGVISAMLAIAALASMTCWPIYRLCRNIHRRGRMPDMSRVRVTISLSILGAVILAFFLVPLPVSRVTVEGVVEMLPDNWENVEVSLAQNNQQVVLEEVYVKDGEWVEKGARLARFSSPDLRQKRDEADGQFRGHAERSKALRVQLDNFKITGTNNEEKKKSENDRGRIETEQNKAEADAEAARALVRFFDRKLDEDAIIKAPRDGMVFGPPRPEEIRKAWDRKNPLCKIGDPRELRVILPVEPPDYNLLQENMREAGSGQSLPAAIRVSGMSRQKWTGQLVDLPEFKATKVPLILSNRSGGPVPVKPGSDPNNLQPQTQVYFIHVYLTNPDVEIRPGVRAKVKIYCKNRTLAWWSWRKINDLFNLGLI